MFGSHRGPDFRALDITSRRELNDAVAPPGYSIWPENPSLTRSWAVAKPLAAGARLWCNLHVVGVPKLGVRVAVPGDGTAIGEAHGAAWEQAYQDLFDPAFVARSAAGRRRGWPLAIRRHLAEDGLLLVGERNGEVMAFAHAGPARDQPALAEIYGFYSHPAAWGSGLASLLLGEICARLANRWQRVVLWTHRDAGRARRFYEKSGFALTGAERIEALSDWIGDATVLAPAVEYAKMLAEGPTRSRTARK